MYYQTETVFYFRMVKFHTIISRDTNANQKQEGVNNHH